MITKETTEEKIIECLEEIKKIMTEDSTNIQMAIASMQSKIKPYEDFLNSLSTVQMDFYYGRSYKIRTLIDDIKDIK